MGRIIILTATLAAIWLLLSGYFDKPLLLGFGVGSVLFSVWIAHRAGVIDRDGVPISLFPGIFGYWWWLFGEIGKANILVMRQALAVEPKLAPKMFTVANAPRTGLGKATFANSITLTPGTVSILLSENEILVHGLTEDVSDIEGIEAMGARVAAIEGAPSSQGGAS